MTKTHEGGEAFTRDPKNELYLRATTMFYGKDSFYEKSSESGQRVMQLGRDLAVSDWEWFSEFLPWLRQDGNVRTMPMVLAVEGIRARLAAKITGFSDGVSHRQLTEKVLQRPDEPGKLLQYHFTHYGKTIPKPLKRGVADAVTRMLNQRQALRYDKPGDMVRLGDVIEYVHPKARDEKQGMLFQHLITSRHDRDDYEPPAELGEIHARWELNKMTPAERHAFAKTIHSDVNAQELWSRALAGSWEWGKLWLGEK